MKIGILTLPLLTNYGGILQAYALQKVLKSMGHDAWLINKRSEPIPSWRYLIRKSKHGVKNILFGQDISILNEKQKKENEAIISQNTQLFIDKYIQPQTDKYFFSKDLSQVEAYNFDACIVGSDQVWRPEYVSNIYDYFFNFIKGKTKKISYAASFGVDYWSFTLKQTSRCKYLAQSFDHISVRENSGVKMCKDYLNVDAMHVLDPTMLLKQSDYLSLIGGSIADKPNQGILVYILDRNKDKETVIHTIEQELCSGIFHVNSETENHSASLKERIAPPVEEWLRGFQKAEFVITDSFHACVFAIIFNIPFIVYGNKDRGLGRFTSLLSKFNLEDRLILSSNDLGKILSNNIDWDHINSILEKERKISFQFLSEALI